MQVLVRQRKAWVRTGTHTVVFDHDPDFEYFRHDPTGEMKGLLRLWLVASGGREQYVGACRLCAGCWEWTDVMRLARRLQTIVAHDRKKRRELRGLVLSTLRGYMAAWDPSQ